MGSFTLKGCLRRTRYLALVGITLMLALTGLITSSHRRELINRDHKNKYSFQYSSEENDTQKMAFVIKNLDGEVMGQTELLVNMTALEESNFTNEQVNQSWIEISPDEEGALVIGDTRIPLDLKMAVVMNLQEIDGNSARGIGMNIYLNKTWTDIQDDPSLKLLSSKKLIWEFPPKCDLHDIFVIVSGHSIDLALNDIIITSYNISKGKTSKRGVVAHLLGEGLMLVVVNPLTCQKTMDLMTFTSDIGGYRELIWGLESILPGRLILVGSLRDGAAFLTRKARKTLWKMGSLWAPFYLYRDSWLNLFVKGGKTVQDVLIPNFGKLNATGSPLSVHLDTQKLVPWQSFVCSSWTLSLRWKKREIFCETHDGFSSLCDCENPLEFKTKIQDTQLNSNLFQAIPLIILVGNRTRHLFHLFESLASQKHVVRENIILVADGHIEETARLAEILDLKLIIHNPEGRGGMRTSRNVRFGLYHGLRFFPTAETIILLEDDLLLSPDFYSFMHQMQPIFNMDKSVFCVSAFNHISYPDTNGDPTLTYRVESYPAYGWMMSRDILKEIIPKWLPGNIIHDWDHYIGTKVIRKGRHCIIPDINRSYHWSTKGVHSGSSYSAETLFLARNMNQDPNTILQPLERLRKENYEKEMIDLLETAIPLPFSKREDLDIAVEQGKTYVIFVSKQKSKEESSFRLFAEELEIWTMDGRDHFNHAWRFFYKNATVFVVGVPISPYTSYMPKGYSVLQGNNKTDQEIFHGEFFYRASLQIPTHFKSHLLPFFG